jgi:hypothetical protein
MFMKWHDNDHLSIKELRLKAITLLAISCMTRPSDLARKGVLFDADAMKGQNILFTTDQVTFHKNGSMSITFFGIKNDAERTGFEIKIPGGSCCKGDPVVALQCYIQRTGVHRPKGSPIFISLVAPYKAISSATIAVILTDSIDLAGMKGQGFTARSFRPTGATAAIAAGCLPETAMQIGRWKTKEVFFNRYVYPNAPAGYTDAVLNYGGLHG